MGGLPLVLAKNVLFHAGCFGRIDPYFAVKGRVMLAAARLGAYERPSMRLLPWFVRTGAVTVDVGANVGAYTHAMARLVGPSGRVVAFEPVPPVAAVLERSCAGMPAVTVVREALSGGRETFVDLHVPYLPGRVPEPSLAYVDGTASPGAGLAIWQTFHVPARRLDDHLDALRGVSFIKADVEGHEMAFLEGASRTVRTFRPCVQLESGGLGRHRATVTAWAERHDYALFSLAGGRLAPVGATGTLSLNVYLLPNEAQATLPPAALASAAHPS